MIFLIIYQNLEMPAGIYERESFEVRFWKKVDKKGDDECWNWTGSTYINGYGTICKDGKVVSAHRSSYELNKGPIPEGLHILHSCDNHACVNPNHLSAGTASDNMRDMVSKDRHGKIKGPSPFKGKPAEKVFGENHGTAYLTEVIVKEIREKYATGNYTYKELLVEYCLKSEGHLYDILRKKIWKHI